MLWRPLHAHAVPLSPALMSFSLSLGPPGHTTPPPPSRATCLTLETPSGAVDAPQQLEFHKSATSQRHGCRMHLLEQAQMDGVL